MQTRARIFAGLALGAVAALLGGPPATPSSGRVARAASSAATGPLLGITTSADIHGTLARLDPGTLTPLPGERTVALDGHTTGWSFSPDRGTLAVGNYGGGPNPVEVRLVDVLKMQTLGTVRLARGDGYLRQSRWISATRLLAVVDGASARSRAQIFLVDASRRRVVRRTVLGGVLNGVESTADGYAVLTAPPGKIGRPRLAVVRPNGSVRSAVLTRIRAGGRFSQRPLPMTFQSHPGLSYDAGANHLYVFTGGDSAADVDLATLAVTYRKVARPVSFWGRLRAWIDPPAGAKAVSGPYRMAQPLSDGLVLVSGGDAVVTGKTVKTLRQRYLPAGVRIVDTKHWSYRVLEPNAESAQAFDDRIVVTGGTYDSNASVQTGVGLEAFSPEGRKLYTVFAGRRVDVLAAYGDRAYVALDGNLPLRVIDVNDGSELGTRTDGVPLLLLGDAAPSWD